MPHENGEEEKWHQPERQPATDEEKKKITAMAVVTAVEAVMANHVYSFDNTWRKQNDGGAIGNLLTREVAKVVMAWWTTQFNDLSATAAPETILVEGSDSLYVDDYNFVFYVLQPGMRWIEEDKRMRIREELIKKDKETHDDVRSTKEIVKMANSICLILQLTRDCPGANTDGKLPILDICCWINADNQIVYEHYSKPIASSLLIMQRSAMPDRVKRAAITQMAIKILENTSPWTRAAQLLSKFSHRMKQSGYNDRFRLNIFQSALKNWDKRLEQDRTGKRPLHREKEWKREEWRKDKEMKEKMWYKKRDKGDAHNTFPIFCPATPKGALAKMWRNIAAEIESRATAESNPGLWNKGGIPIKSILCKNSPAETNECGKTYCPICRISWGDRKNTIHKTERTRKSPPDET